MLSPILKQRQRLNKINLMADFRTDCPIRSGELMKLSVKHREPQMKQRKVPQLPKYESEARVSIGAKMPGQYESG